MTKVKPISVPNHTTIQNSKKHPRYTYREYLALPFWKKWFVKQEFTLQEIHEYKKEIIKELKRAKQEKIENSYREELGDAIFSLREEVKEGYLSTSVSFGRGRYDARDRVLALCKKHFPSVKFQESRNNTLTIHFSLKEEDIPSFEQEWKSFFKNQ